MEAVGHTVHVVCPDKKAGDMIKTSLHDFEGHQTYTEKLGHLADINKTFSEAERSSTSTTPSTAPAAAVRNTSAPTSACRRWSAISTRPEKPIFTICHGVQILIAVDGVVRASSVAALGACEPEVTLAGGTYIDLSPTDAYVDGTMVSAKGWTALAAFMRECLKVLGTEIHHGEVRTLATAAE